MPKTTSRKHLQPRPATAKMNALSPIPNSKVLAHIPARGIQPRLLISALFPAKTALPHDVVYSFLLTISLLCELRAGRIYPGQVSSFQAECNEGEGIWGVAMEMEKHAR